MKQAAYYRNVRTDIVPLVDRAERVLEVGCAEGATLAHLKQHDLAGWTCGIERLAEPARIAARVIDEVHVGDVEAMALPVEPGSIDLLLTLDVLEHLVDPWRALRRLAVLLRPGGRVIASVPNVRHVSVLAPLVLRGDWRYAAAGVLDDTHLRFFTRRTAIELVEQAGLRVEIVRATGIGWKGRALGWFTVGMATPFLELQYLIRARRV